MNGHPATLMTSQESEHLATAGTGYTDACRVRDGEASEQRIREAAC